MAHENYKPVLEITRGNIVESVHFGAIAVVDAAGTLVASWGDPATKTYLRSSAKPFQAMPLIELGGAETFGLTDREIAVTCASHSGTDEHAGVIRSIQQKVGVREDNLQCGVHEPFHRPTALAMLQRGEEPTSIRHNCSGKHTGMLAQATLRGLPIEDYLNPGHPVQQLDLQTFAEMCSVDINDIDLGIDGCSAPVWAIPLQNAALGYARLVNPAGLPPARAAACRRIVRAMTSNPDMVAGPERFDTVLMECCSGKVVAKGGAEGYQGMGILPDVLHPGHPGLGIALKISDGDAGGRAVSAVALEVLRQLGLLSAEQIAALPKFGSKDVLNWRKLVAGEIRPVFELIKGGG